MYVGEITVKQNIYQHLLTKGKLMLWSQFENLMGILSRSSIDQVNHFELAVHHWKLHMENEESTDDLELRQFLYEQLLLSTKRKAARRYSSDMYRFAACIYTISSSCYKALLNSNALTLPCVDTLKKMLNVLTLDCSAISDDNLKYIKSKSQKLSDEDKLVNLLIDEIHIKKGIRYKAKRVSGFAENDENKEATSVQAFMICSYFSSYKEIVALVPVTCMTSEDLFKLTCQTLHMLHTAGFEVLSVISDNNSVNGNMFSLLANGALIDAPIRNPASGTNLYLLFDAVHLLKSIRNNWLNQADKDKTFTCPIFEDEKGIIRPQETEKTIIRPRLDC
ncbi:hypothetical protein JTE90_012454 [Oedothorax gibbosus]|uniref:Transposable element P transposase-like RNase H domain-containing protein n=1 Tax=Oedothorax gibbosus TaxID=931172 RepID=A0AAV6UEC5_9ARAC|nr:hypothetical protein JTE90_012454 [Oedothorax gibbosus]